MLGRLSVANTEVQHAKLHSSFFLCQHERSVKMSPEKSSHLIDARTFKFLHQMNALVKVLCAHKTISQLTCSAACWTNDTGFEATAYQQSTVAPIHQWIARIELHTARPAFAIVIFMMLVGDTGVPFQLLPLLAI